MDLDVLDPAYAPAVNDPVPNGLTSRELFSVLPKIGTSNKLKALDVVELIPRCDPAGLTAWTATAFITEILGARAARI